MISFSAILLITLSAFLDILSLVLIKNVLNTINLNFNELIKYKNFIILLSNKKFLLGIFLFTVSPIFFFIAIINTDLIKAYPLNLSLKIVFNLILAYVFLKEMVSIKQILGLLLLIISIFLLV